MDIYVWIICTKQSNRFLHRYRINSRGWPVVFASNRQKLKSIIRKQKNHQFHLERVEKFYFNYRLFNSLADFFIFSRISSEILGPPVPAVFPIPPLMVPYRFVASKTHFVIIFNFFVVCFPFHIEFLASTNALLPSVVLENRKHLCAAIRYVPRGNFKRWLDWLADCFFFPFPPFRIGVHERTLGGSV